jgi:hypothetical protein
MQKEQRINQRGIKMRAEYVKLLCKKTYHKQLSSPLRAGNPSMVAMLQSMADFLGYCPQLRRSIVET